MLRVIGIFGLMGLAVLSAMTLAGEGSPWMRYAGGGTIVALLFAILGTLGSLKTRIEGTISGKKDDGSVVYEPKPAGEPNDKPSEAKSPWRN